MALQLAAEREFNLTLDQTKDLLSDWGIDHTLSVKWEGVKQLVDHNALGAVKLLVAHGALKASQDDLEFDIDVEDLSGAQCEAWSQYSEHVLHWLTQINPTAALAGARQEIRDDIIEDFVTKAPSYPSTVGESSSVFTYDIADYDEVENSNNLYLWAALGTVNMQDTKMGESLYRSHIWGKPVVTIRCVKFDKHKMNHWEQLCIEDWSNAKRMADGATKYSIKDLGSKLAAIGF